MIMISVLLIALCAWLLSFILPWWSLGIPALLLGAIAGRTGWSSFCSGFLGIGGWWLVHSIYIHLASGGILTTRMSDLFGLPHPSLVILITMAAGGLAGGLSALTGYLLNKTFSF